MADLAAPRWKLTPRGIQIESKEDIIRRLGRSPDKGDAVVMCWSEGERAARRKLRDGRALQTHANVAYAALKGDGFKGTGWSSSRRPSQAHVGHPNAKGR